MEMKHLMLLGLLAGLWPYTEVLASKPIWVTRCSDPQGHMLFFNNDEVTSSKDEMSPITLTLVFYDEDISERLWAKIITTGRSERTEEGEYRVYGDKENVILEAIVRYPAATWVYSLFTSSKLLYIHSTKSGMIGNPTAHLFAARCE